MSGVWGLAYWLVSAPPSWVAAVDIVDGKIARVIFTGKDAPPPFARGASRARSAPVGPARPGCGPVRAPNSARRSPPRRAARGPPRAPDRGCPLLCAGQSLAWLVPTPPVFAVGVPSATQRFVCRARRLRAFAWLSCQFLARRRLARVVRESSPLARARCRVAAARRLVALARGFLARRRFSVSAMRLAVTPVFAPGRAPAADGCEPTRAVRPRAVRLAAAGVRAHAARSARFGDRRAVVVAPLARSGLKRSASPLPPLPPLRSRRFSNQRVPRTIGERLCISSNVTFGVFPADLPTPRCPQDELVSNPPRYHFR
jgi:hypothetical protein